MFHEYCCSTTAGILQQPRWLVLVGVGWLMSTEGCDNEAMPCNESSGIRKHSVMGGVKNPVELLMVGLISAMDECMISNHFKVSIS